MALNFTRYVGAGSVCTVYLPSGNHMVEARPGALHGVIDSSMAPLPMW